MTLDVVPRGRSNGWDRVRDPDAAAERTRLRRGARSTPRSARSSRPIPLEHASVHRAKHDEGDVLAAACGDLDGDGGMELVLVSRARVAVGRT